MGGGEERTWHVPAPGATTDGWQGDPISSGADDAFTDPVVFALDAGRHQLRIRDREDGTRLRELRVTNKPFPAAPWGIPRPLFVEGFHSSPPPRSTGCEHNAIRTCGAVSVTI